MKKNSNKGFSLVELIVVIAIMGVLMVVLAPQYLRYVEKTRLQKDNSLISDIAETIKIACADDNIAKDLPTAPFTITGTNAAGSHVEFKLTESDASYAGVKKIAEELQKSLTEEGKGTIKTSSNTYKASGNAIVFTVKYDATTSGYAIKADGLILEAGSTTTTTMKY